MRIRHFTSFNHPSGLPHKLVVIRLIMAMILLSVWCQPLASSEEEYDRRAFISNVSTPREPLKPSPPHHQVGDGNYRETKTVRRRNRAAVNVQGKVLCDVCWSNRTEHFVPLRGSRVKVECRSKYGEYETVGICNGEGTFRVRISGAEGYRWPLRFCTATLLRKSVPSKRCGWAAGEEKRQNVKLLNKSATKAGRIITLGVDTFIVRPPKSLVCPLKHHNE